MSSKSIVEVPSEVITEILKYCVGQDVLNFSEAFNNFDKILSAIMDNRLWKNAVIGPKDLKKYMKYLGSHTKSLTIVGSGTKSQKNNKGKQSSSSSALTESLISSICLRCTKLESFCLRKIVIDTQVIKFSLFPKTIRHLKLDDVSMINLPQMRAAVRSSPFFCIKKCLPKLESLELCNPWYLQSFDSFAIVGGCPETPILEINGEDHSYTFPNFDNSSDQQEPARDKRKDAKKLMKELIEYHFVKKSYNTRRIKPK